MPEEVVQPDCCARKSRISPLKICLLLAVVALLVTAFWQARAQDAPSSQPIQGRVVRLSDVEGQVLVTTAEDAPPDNGLANMPLVQGSMVQTGSDGLAEIQFEDGSVVRLVPNSRAEITDLEGAAPGQLATQVELSSGEAYFELTPAAGDKFTVNALGLQISTGQPSSFRVSWLAQPEQVAVSDGTVRIRHAGDYNVQVNANETLSIDDADVTRYLLSTGTDSDVNDAWNEARDQAEADDAANSAPGQPSQADDLSEYGSYYDMPGVGEVWQPYGYGSTWDPYDAGYWAWYPWGYTWVSAYPWGWAPYHCGYWNYFPGWGWGWVNNGCGIGGWYPIGIWHDGPGGWHGPQRPIWHPIRPTHPIHPVGIIKVHPGQPVPVHRLPSGFKPVQGIVGGKTLQPLRPAPHEERPGGAGEPRAAGPVPVHRAFGTAGGEAGIKPASPVYGSRAGNPELGRGGTSHPQPGRPAPVQRSSPPPAQHFSPPASHSESSSKK